MLKNKASRDGCTAGFFIYLGLLNKVVYEGYFSSFVVYCFLERSIYDERSETPISDTHPPMVDIGRDNYRQFFVFV